MIIMMLTAQNASRKSGNRFFGRETLQISGLKPFLSDRTISSRWERL
jgi:hypothetical protein